MDSIARTTSLVFIAANHELLAEVAAREPSISRAPGCGPKVYSLFSKHTPHDPGNYYDDVFEFVLEHRILR